MPSAKLKRIAADIKSMKLQGAENVRIAVVEAIAKEAGESRAGSIKELRNEMRKGILLLAQSRPTEPEVRTALMVVLKALQSKADSADELKRRIAALCRNYESDRERALKKISEFGARIIPNGTIALTHCHSSTVENILARAWKEKKLKGVICTETRPKFQGRITAENLAKKGIPVTMIVDSAAYSIMRKADIFITGADAVLANGDVINKIGTSQISLAAAKENVPHYVACSSHKFDPLTTFGGQEAIEERNPNEVWEKKMRNFRIINQAFDITSARLVKEIISELGCLAPASFVSIVYERLGLEKSGEEDFSLMGMLKKMKK